MPTLFTFADGLLAGALMALLLYHAATACLLFGGRAAELASNLTGFWQDPAARNINRTGERAHRANGTLMPVLHTQTILPGLALFALGIAEWLLEVNVNLGEILGRTGDAIDTALVCAFVVLSALAPVPLGPRRNPGGSLRYTLARFLNLAALAPVGLIAWKSGFSVDLIVSGLFIGMALRACSYVVLHGVMLHGVFSPIYMPFAITGWALRIAAIAFLGPVVFVVPRLLRGEPIEKPFGLSHQRQSAVAGGTEDLPRNMASDSVLGAIRAI